MSFRTSSIARTLLLALLLAAGLPVGAATPAGPGASGDTATGIDDGPYVFRDASGLIARWVCDGAPVVERIRVRRWPATVPVRCGVDRPIEVRAPVTSRGTVDLRGIRRIAAMSDLHGQYDLVLRLLQANGLVDAQGDWSWGDGHLVVVGDVFDRGPEVTGLLWLLYRLEGQASAAGGGLHLLLGNHETMVMYRDLRYVNDRYFVTANALGIAYSDLHGPASVLGEWLRGRPVIARIDDLLFVHGGISPGFLALGIDADTANGRYRDSLGLPRRTTREDPRYAPLYDGHDSPIWYRGYFDDAVLGSDGVAAIARRLGVDHVVVGHTSQAHVESRHGGLVVAVDSSIKEGESGELLFVEDGVMSRGLLDGRRVPLAPEPEDAGLH